MFVNRARESPSVASTRVLKTHRMNSVENFRLQERVKTIDFESQHNYSQISDEIDGVRQNLVKIKGVKKNMGVSVERRKLLRDKGLRILPSKQKGNADHFTVRLSNGKDVNIRCSDFYDGDTLRKQLNIDNFERSATPTVEAENSDSEDLIDFASASNRGRSFSMPTLNLKEFRYRKITPPLRPGSRRNFRDVEDEKSEDDEKLLNFENFGNRERKYGIFRPHTAGLDPRPRSRTCPANIQDNESTTRVRKLSRRKSSAVVGSSRKKSRTNDALVSGENTSEKSIEQEVEPGNHQREVSHDSVVYEETISLKPSLRPALRVRSMTAPVRKQGTSISHATADLRRMSLDTEGEQGVKLPPSPSFSSGRWSNSGTPETSPRDPKKSVTIANDQFPPSPSPSSGRLSHSGTPETSPRVPKKSVTIANEENIQREPRKVSRPIDRKVSWMDNVQGRNDNINYDNNKSGDTSLPDRPGVVRRVSALSTNSQQSNAGRAQSAPHQRPSVSRKASKANGRRSSQDFVYDARPGKALSKGYVTMQMTIGNKQVKVYVPKFSPGECLDDVTVERARAKSAVKAAVGNGRPQTGNKK